MEQGNPAVRDRLFTGTHLNHPLRHKHVDEFVAIALPRRHRKKDLNKHNSNKPKHSQGKPS
jgi:hypothetical protein